MIDISWTNVEMKNDVPQALGIMCTRWNSAKRIVEQEAKFIDLKNDYGSGQTWLKMKLKLIEKQVVRDKIIQANEAAAKWIRDLNHNYLSEVTDQYRNAFNAFYDGQGMIRVDINWRDFKTYSSNRDAWVRSLVLSAAGDKVSMDNYPEKNQALKEMAKKCKKKYC